MKETWQPERGQHMPTFDIRLALFKFVFCLLWIALANTSFDDPIARMLELPVLIVLTLDAIAWLYRYYLSGRRRMRHWSMTFDGDNLTIFRPKEKPLTIQKGDCSWVYPLTGVLILRDGQTIPLCSPAERLEHCEKRAGWLEQWWPGFLRLALVTNRNTRPTESTLFLGALLTIALTALGGLALITQTNFDHDWVMRLAGACMGIIYGLPKTVFWSNWYQQPIKIDDFNQGGYGKESVTRA